jgi:hypothetical protein
MGTMEILGLTIKFEIGKIVNIIDVGSEYINLPKGAD